mmetsp:Transcript_156195/g.501107  ORF Transcript_156195/g.501107 Transcript_156195/m.501107 type:complete len:309 (-) Transcript_156195:137-1063(-)
MASSFDVALRLHSAPELVGLGEPSAKGILWQERGQRWADVADSEGEEDEEAADFEWGLLLPSCPMEQRVRRAGSDDVGNEATTTLPHSRSASSVEGDAAQLSRGPIDESASRARSMSSFNVEAAEFIPAVSHVSPLVAVAEVLRSEAPRLRKRKGRGQRTAAAAPAEGQDDHRNEETAEVTKQDFQPQEFGSMPYASEEVWQHREEMRRKEVNLFKAKLLRLVGASNGDAKPTEAQCCAIEGLATHDPADRSMSRRSWRKFMDQWFKDLLVQWLPEEGHGSTASGDERQSLANASTNCDDGRSECSSD